LFEFDCWGCDTAAWPGCAALPPLLQADIISATLNSARPTHSRAAQLLDFWFDKVVTLLDYFLLFQRGGIFQR
jgi:hypothetical protein